MTKFQLRFALLAAACILGCAQSSFAQTVVSDPSTLTWYKTRSSDTATANTTTQSVLLTEGQTSASTFLTNFPTASVTVGQTLTLQPHLRPAPHLAPPQTPSASASSTTPPHRLRPTSIPTQARCSATTPVTSTA